MVPRICVCVCLCVYVCVNIKNVFLTVGLASFLPLIKKVWKAYSNPNPNPSGHLSLSTKCISVTTLKSLWSAQASSLHPHGHHPGWGHHYHCPNWLPCLEPYHTHPFSTLQGLFKIWELISYNGRVNWRLQQEGRGLEEGWSRGPALWLGRSRRLWRTAGC